MLALYKEQKTKQNKTLFFFLNFKFLSDCEEAIIAGVVIKRIGSIEKETGLNPGSITW